jgi:AcrR family transcriptional regulator
LSSPKRRSPKLSRPGPKGGARDRNRQDNCERLCAAALGLFLADGSAVVTIDQICERAEMAKGSFYRYARDKSDLIAQILAPVIDETTQALARCEHALRNAGATPIAAIYLELARQLSQMVALHAPRVLFYLQESRAPMAAAAIQELADRLTAQAITLTEIARDHGLIRAVDPEVSALVVLGAIDALLFAHLRRRRVRPTVVTDLVDIVLRGIRV